MKRLKIATLCLLTLSTLTISSYAADCVDNEGKDISNSPEIFQELIAQKEHCFEAKDMAEACGWGSLVDLQTVAAAYGVCQKELDNNQPNQKQLALLTSMKDACSEKYSDMDGTMYRSMNAYCHLSALQWIVNLSFKEE